MTDTATKPETLDALAPYNEVRANLAELKAENAALSFDYKSKAGNKAARSHVAILRKRKADVERIRKSAKAEALEYGRKVDGAAKEITAEIEDMISVHETPLKEIEEREAARIEGHRARLAELAMPQEIITDSKTCKEIALRIANINTAEGWDEFKAEAHQTKEQTVLALKLRYNVLKKQEEEAAELEALRKEKAEREEKDRIEREQQETKQRAEQEAAAAKAREEQIRKEAEEKARQEAEAKAAAERKAEADKAMAEARRKEAEANAAIEAERRKAEEAKAEAERVKREAEQAEAKRQREEQERKEADAKRAADQQHRQTVLDAVAAAIAERAGISDEAALFLAVDISDGKVPHTSIKF